MTIDRTRKFSLPDIQDLSKDQEEALALPLRGQHLIIGGPGTGKSVIALLRARKLAAEGKRYRLLVYNRTLNDSNRQLFGSDSGLESATWEGWFREMYKHIFPGQTLPTRDEQGYSAIDWEALQQSFDAVRENFAPPLDDSHFLIIDEGQDMPPAFYETLVDWGLENFYVLADQNQRLERGRNSSRRNIEDILDIQNTLELRSNWRNTRPIAFLAQHFYPDDPASPKPELPPPAPSAHTPVLMHYADVDNIAGRILKLSDRFPKKLIGIIAPDNVIREKFLAALAAAKPALDHGRPPVQTYVWGIKKKLNFSTGGIMVINAQACKGLEFDITVLADIDLHQPKDNEYQLKSRFYVMASRAREQLILLRSGTPDPTIETLLPPADSGLLSCMTA